MSGYKCVHGHDRCDQMHPGPECPYCVKAPRKPSELLALLALRARVAKLEAALEEIAERRFLAETMIEIARAALKGAPP